MGWLEGVIMGEGWIAVMGLMELSNQKMGGDGR